MSTAAMIPAIAWHGPEDLRLIGREERPVASDGLLVEVAAIGICGTDLHQYHGDDGGTDPGTVIGHEFGGVVTAVGRDVAASWDIGEVVAIDPNAGCAACPACIAGAAATCPRRELLGAGRDGGLAARVGIPAHRAVRIAGDPDPRAAALVEPVAVGVHACARAGVRAGERIGIIGGGFIGAACARVVRELGARPVLIEPDASRRARLEAWGAEVTAPTDVAARDWDRAIDTVAHAATTPAALDRLRRGGTLCLVGLAGGTTLSARTSVVREELTVLGSFCYDRSELEASARIVAVHGLDTIPVDCLPGLDAAPGVIAALAAGTLTSGKPLIIP